MGNEKNYYIKENYECNITESNTNIKTYFEPPRLNTYQISVYKYIGKLAKKIKAKNVLELGFGNGHKTMKYVRPYCSNVFGVDLPHSVNYARNKFPEENWVEGNFDEDIKIAGAESFDIIYSVDVIEHLIFPEKLLNTIKHLADFNTLIILSTP
ncbi:MAG: class I SAM-dependent methyltransferase, partial [bacterium]